MVGKFIVNHCVRSVYAGVGLFHMYSEGILVDGHSESEGGNFAVYMQDASGQSQFFKIVEGVDQCATFVARSFMLVAVVGLTPFSFQVQTFLDAVGSDGSIFVIIGAFEFVDMIPFGLEFLSGKRGEVCTQIEVIGIVPVCCELEFSGHEGFQFRAHARTYSQQAERFPFPVCVFDQCVQYFCQISVTYRHHVHQFIVCPEFQQEEAVHDGKLCIV